jgi:hypothetical protein
MRRPKSKFSCAMCQKTMHTLDGAYCLTLRYPSQGGRPAIWAGRDRLEAADCALQVGTMQELDQGEESEVTCLPADH